MNITDWMLPITLISTQSCALVIELNMYIELNVGPISQPRCREGFSAYLYVPGAKQALLRTGLKGDGGNGGEVGGPREAE